MVELFNSLEPHPRERGARAGRTKTRRQDAQTEHRDLPTQCAGLNGCRLQQWDSNGGLQQIWSFVQQNQGQQNFPPPGGVTILVNGSWNDDPDWVNPSDPEYAAIGNTFSTQPTNYQWGPNGAIYPPYYADIVNGGPALADCINSLNIPAEQPLSIVTHSHGGNVVKVASQYSLNHRIDYLVNLGTPQNWDLPEMNLAAMGTYCQVSSLTDRVQFLGSSPTQYLGFGYSQGEAGIYLYQEGVDLYNGCYSCALADAEEAAFWEANAFGWWISAKLAVGAWNVVYVGPSHSDLHTPGWWYDISRDCGLSN